VYPKDQFLVCYYSYCILMISRLLQVLFEFFLFSDDTNLLYKDKSLPLLEALINEELINVCDWSLANKLTLNAKRSNYVIFHPYQQKIQSVINLKVFDNEYKAFRILERKQFVKYLGVLIDSNLSWNHHVANVALKISKTIGIITRLRHFLPTSVLLNTYNSLIHPYLSYSLVVWGQASKTNLDKMILLLQKRALCLIYFSNNSEHAIPLFLRSNILLIDMLYYKSVVVFS